MGSWDNITQWHLVLPPSRPSRYHLDIFKNVSQSIERDLPVAVLGCTPELRDLLYLLGFKRITLFEKSSKMLAQMNALRCFANTEEVIFGDWVETLPAFIKHFALIVSDLTSGNIPYEMQPIFYKSICNALRVGGYFVDKILTQQREKRRLSDLTNKYSVLPVNLLAVNYFSCEFLFCSELLNIRNMVDSTLFYEILGSEFGTEILKKFLSESSKVTPYDCTWFYGKEWAEIEKYYCTSMKRIAVFDDEKDSPYYGNLKILIGNKT